MALPFTKTNNLNKNIMTMSTALVLIILIHLKYPFFNSSLLYKKSEEIVPMLGTEDIKLTNYSDQEKCDIFLGEWVPDPDAPYYTNDTCWAIHEHQNCMKHGRPDSGFLKWKWKPNGCELPVFDPYEFLDMVRNKSLAFVGDSVGRNQMQSMICLLSRVESPIDVSPTPNESFKRWKYVNTNFTLAFFWAPFLVQSKERDFDAATYNGIFNLYLDEPNDSWNNQIDEFDYIILNAGHWFFRTAMYYENRRIIGCLYCNQPNLTDLDYSYGYRRALQTTLKTMNERKKFKGITFLRTFAQSHFENGLWNTGGNCVRKRPFRSNETVLEGSNLDMYMIQLEEFRAVEKKGEKKFRLLDTTRAMLLRPDGHPGKYWHWAYENVTVNDCLHWCLPGPIDTWADFLLHLVKVEAGS